MPQEKPSPAERRASLLKVSESVSKLMANVKVLAKSLSPQELAAMKDEHPLQWELITKELEDSQQKSSST